MIRMIRFANGMIGMNSLRNLGWQKGDEWMIRFANGMIGMNSFGILYD